MTEEMTWDEATAQTAYVRIEDKKKKVVVISDYKILKVNKFDKVGIPEFVAEIIEEDNVKVEKQWTTVSYKLIKELKEVLSTKNIKAGPIRLGVMRVGDGKNTQYAVSLEK